VGQTEQTEKAQDIQPLQQEMPEIPVTPRMNVANDTQDMSPAAQQMLLRIDELAQHVNLPSRTIRFYNTHGLLPPPLMHGRIAFYTHEHMQVLFIIRDLREQQHLPLDTIKHLLDIRAQQGDLPMNLALKQRLHFTTGESDQRYSMVEFAQRCNIPLEQVHELLKQELLFPIDIEGESRFSGDDVLLVELYRHLENMGLPLALATLLRFQLRQLVRSEIAAYEQHLLPRWKDEELSLEEQTERFERMLTLTDTLISIMHRRLLYQA